jgi:hypothetical protein
MEKNEEDISGPGKKAEESHKAEMHARPVSVFSPLLISNSSLGSHKMIFKATNSKQSLKC